MSKARRAPLPNVRVGDRNLQAFLDGVRERLEVGSGERPKQNALDRYATLRDIGVVNGKTSLNRLLYGDVDTGGVGGDGTFLGVDPLTGLTATGAVETVILVWGNTKQPNYAYTEVWRATVDDLGSAVLVGQTPASLFADDAQVVIGTGYFYWIRPVSKSGDPGPFNQVAGTPATPGMVGPGVIEVAAIDSAHIASAAIVEAKIAAAAIHSAHIANAQITFAKIADAAVDTAKIADAAINTAKIVNAAITNAKIANAAVDTLKIANQAVTVPAGSSSGTVVDGSVSGNNTHDSGWTTLVSTTLDALGQSISVIAEAGFSIKGTVTAGTAEAKITFRLQRDGNTIKTGATSLVAPGNASHSTDSSAGSAVLVYVESPSSGNHTYRLQVRGELATTEDVQEPGGSSASFSASQAGIVAMGLKR